MGSHNKDFITEHIARTIINLAEYQHYFSHQDRYGFTQLMNSVSGLLILPVEFIIKASKNNQPLPFNDVLKKKVSDLNLNFAKNINSKLKNNYDNLDLENFLRLIRNSFSHFNLEPICLTPFFGHLFEKNKVIKNSRSC
jgi:hypothetical protein